MIVPTIEDSVATIKAVNIIGEGSSRTVYWDGKSQWAFKVGHTQWTTEDSNASEFENWTAIKDVQLPAGVRIPEMHMLTNGVLAVEHINGWHPESSCWGMTHECDNEGTCWYTQFETSGIERIKGFGDVSYANVIMADDGIYVIDLEF